MCFAECVKFALHETFCATWNHCSLTSHLVIRILYCNMGRSYCFNAISVCFVAYRPKNNFNFWSFLFKKTYTSQSPWHTLNPSIQETRLFWSRKVILGQSGTEWDLDSKTTGKKRERERRKSYKDVPVMSNVLMVVLRKINWRSSAVLIIWWPS